MRETAPGGCVDADVRRFSGSAENGLPLPQCDIRGGMEREKCKLVATGMPMSLPNMTAVPISQFADYLPGMLGRPVINRTGLLGRYDFAMEFGPDGLTPGLADSSDENGSIGPSLLAALLDQLGLKLEASKEPVEHLIIDYVTRPEEN
jgi:uncharacterized protein (TIGR03435 family)